MKYFNLIIADLGRVIKSKPIYILLSVNFALSAFNVFLMTVILRVEIAGIEMDIGGEFFRLVVLSTFSVQNLGLFIGLAVSIFCGGDFSFNTIRNKIISGNSRIKIYMSALAVALIIALFFFIVNFVISLISAVIVSQGFYMTRGLIGTVALFIPLYLAITATIIFVTMSLKSRVVAIGINLGSIIFLSTVLMLLAMSPISNYVIMSAPHGIVDLVAMEAMMMVGSTAINGRFVSIALLVSIIYFVAFTIAGAIKFKYTGIK